MAAFVGCENVLALTIRIGMRVSPCLNKSEISFICFPSKGTATLIDYMTIIQIS